MKSRIAALFLSLMLFSCHTDSLEFLDIGSTVEPNRNLNVLLASYYLWLSQTSILDEDIIRDSIHFAVALPEGWMPQAMEVYPATHWRPLKGVSITDMDSIQAMEQFPGMQDSLMMFTDRMNHMMPDYGAQAVLENASFDLEDTSGNSFTMNSADMGTWSAYSGEFALSIPAGEPMDIMMPMEGGDSIGIDSIGYIMVPIFISLSLRAGPTERLDSIYFYSKSGPMRDLSGEPAMLDMDYGSIKFHQVLVTTQAGTRKWGGGPAAHSEIQLRRSGSSYVFQAPGSGQARAEIWDTEGRLISTLTPEARGAFRWPAAGASAGRYIISLEQDGTNLSRLFYVP